MNFSLRFFFASLLATVFLASGSAFAVDGVVEINQARAEIGGISDTDTPGFPVTIDQPGSYRLTGNVVVDGSTNAIHIVAKHVSIDLNGFSIQGPVICPNGGNCSQGYVNGADGVKAASGADFLSVRNGSIFGMGGRGLDCNNAEACVADELSITSNAGGGIGAGKEARISNCVIKANSSFGAVLSFSTIVDSNIFTWNGGQALRLNGDGVTIRNNIMRFNKITEIDFNSKIAALGGNSFESLIAGGWFKNASNMVEISPNLCIDASPSTNCTGL